MANVALRLTSRATENRTVAPATPLRRPNSELRTREHLTPAEVEKLIEAAKQNRWGHRASATRNWRRIGSRISGGRFTPKVCLSQNQCQRGHVTGSGNPHAGLGNPTARFGPAASRCRSHIRKHGRS
jgi:hypothetical protein